MGNNTSVIIEVKDGIVQAVYASAPVSVEVIDLDVDGDEMESALVRLTDAAKKLSCVW